MKELIRLEDFALIELRLWELFPVRCAGSIHAFLPREEVLGLVIDDLGLKQVTERDIVEYAAATRQNAVHWPYGFGRRFLMSPIVKPAPGGGIVSYCGPGTDCGTEGYEIGLWRTKTEDDPAQARYPQIYCHPVEIAYPILRTLIAKTH